MTDTVDIKIRRQDGREKNSYWEHFSIPYRPHMNVISLLMEIQRNPVNAEGQSTSPVVWDCSCLEEVCGACSMVINGRVRQACSARVDSLEQPIVLEPMSKFPCVRDLAVDRSRMFETLKRVRAWIPIDGTYELGPGPKMSERERAEAYEFSRCMTCGCCVEACPQVNDRSKFIGAFAMGQVQLFNKHPTGKMQKEDRLDGLLGEGGLTECGNAQNCEAVCPKEIPLTRAIAEAGWDLTKHAVKKFFR